MIAPALDGAADARRRGDMICCPHDHPRVERELQAMVCRMSERPLQSGARDALEHTTRRVRAFVLVDEAGNETAGAGPIHEPRS